MIKLRSLLPENRKLGKSLPETGYLWKKVIIYRAQKSSDVMLRDKDYVTLSIKFAKEHSDHMTAVSDELYHVVKYMVSAKDVYEAWNPSEYFYSGPEMTGVEIYNSTEFLNEVKMKEVVYPNMVGIHELSLFYNHADLNTQLEVDDLLETGNKEAAWDIINNFLRTIGKLTLAENIQTDLIEQVKYSLYEYEGYTSWKEFVDNQSLGDCQMIVSSIVNDFLQFKKHFGHIHTDEPYYSQENDEVIDVMTHHWVSLNGIPYEFSKGTLKNYIYFNDLYSVEVEDISKYD